MRKGVLTLLMWVAAGVLASPVLAGGDGETTPTGKDEQGYAEPDRLSVPETREGAYQRYTQAEVALQQQAINRAIGDFSDNRIIPAVEALNAVLEKPVMPQFRHQALYYLGHGLCSHGLCMAGARWIAKAALDLAEPELARKAMQDIASDTGTYAYPYAQALTGRGLLGDPKADRRYQPPFVSRLLTYYLFSPETGDTPWMNAETSGGSLDQAADLLTLKALYTFRRTGPQQASSFLADACGRPTLALVCRHPTVLALSGRLLAHIGQADLAPDLFAALAKRGARETYHEHAWALLRTGRQREAFDLAMQGWEGSGDALSQVEYALIAASAAELARDDGRSLPVLYAALPVHRGIASLEELFPATRKHIDEASLARLGAALATARVGESSGFSDWERRHRQWQDHYDQELSLLAAIMSTDDDRQELTPAQAALFQALKDQASQTFAAGTAVLNREVMLLLSAWRTRVHAVGSLLARATLTAMARTRGILMQEMVTLEVSPGKQRGEPLPGILNTPDLPQALRLLKNRKPFDSGQTPGS